MRSRAEFSRGFFARRFCFVELRPFKAECIPEYFVACCFRLRQRGCLNFCRTGRVAMREEFSNAALAIRILLSDTLSHTLFLLLKSQNLVDQLALEANSSTSVRETERNFHLKCPAYSRLLCIRLLLAMLEEQLLHS